jgi:hypothetical protein
VITDTFCQPHSLGFVAQNDARDVNDVKSFRMRSEIVIYAIADKLRRAASLSVAGSIRVVRVRDGYPATFHPSMRIVQRWKELSRPRSLHGGLQSGWRSRIGFFSSSCWIKQTSQGGPVMREFFQTKSKHAKPDPSTTPVSFTRTTSEASSGDAAVMAPRLGAIVRNS